MVGSIWGNHLGRSLSFTNSTTYKIRNSLRNLEQRMNLQIFLMGYFYSIILSKKEHNTFLKYLVPYYRSGALTMRFYKHGFIDSLRYLKSMLWYYYCYNLSLHLRRDRQSKPRMAWVNRFAWHVTNKDKLLIKCEN